jgi:two-component system, sensor histidine kinase and response regulator
MAMAMNHKAKIVIIDDEEVVLDSCTQILHGRNYDVLTAADGSQGLKLVEETKPDLVFIDLKMPGIPGLEVLEKIHTQDDTIVTVVITGYATVDSAVDAMKRGAYDFLPKPFTPDEFRLITKRGLERRRLVIEAITLRREKELLRENFAAIVSHELKSPLGAIQQNLFALSGELADKLSESQNARLERMKIRIDDLIKLINSWLRVYSVDMSKIKENFTVISISSLIMKAMEIVEPHAMRKDVHLTTHLDEQLACIEGDETSLIEALVNIIGNAVKYSFAGGQVEIKGKETDGAIEITISDSGVGIPENELPNVLSDFYRGSTDENSHGIGLTISRKIIEAHNGSISVASKPSVGTTFSIQIPVLKGNRSIASS